MEIFWNGTWGTISDTDWGTSEAQVVCQQLGLSTGGKANCVILYMKFVVGTDVMQHAHILYKKCLLRAKKNWQQRSRCD